VTSRFVALTTTGDWFEVLDDNGQPLGYVQWHRTRWDALVVGASSMTEQERITAGLRYALACYAKTQRPAP
jgi:hypothetical protein